MYDDDDIPRRKAKKGGGGSGIAFLALVALVGGGIWYAWNGGLDAKKAKKLISGDLFKASASDALNAAPDKAASLKEKGDALLKSGVELLIEKPKDIGLGILSSVKDAAVEAARTEAAKILGAPVGTSGDDPGVSIVRPVRQNLSLLLGANTEDLLYAIDWGDKQTAEGSAKKGESKAIDHAWPDAGDYTITVVITGVSTGKKTYSFPVTIQK